MIGIAILALAACGSGADEDPPNLVAPITRPALTPTPDPADLAASPSPTDAPTLDPITLGPGSLEAATWAPDGAWLALSGSRGVWRWEYTAAETLDDSAQVILPGAIVLAFSADGSRAVGWLASAAEENTAPTGAAPYGALSLVTWTVTDGIPTDPVVLEPAGSTVLRAVISPDGSQAAALLAAPANGADDLTARPVLRVYDAVSGSVSSEPMLPERRLIGLAYRPDGVLVWAGTDHNIPEIQQTRTGPERLLPAASAVNDVRLWQAGAEAPYATLTGLEGPPAQIVFSADGRRVAGIVETYQQGVYSVRVDAAVHVWDGASGARLLSPPVISDSPVTLVALSPDGARLAAVTDEHLPTEDARMRRTASAIELWDIDEQRLIAHLAEDDLASATGTMLSVLAFSPDGSRLMGQSWGGTVWVWDTGADTGSGALVARTDAFLSSVIGLAYTPDGSTLISGETSGMIRLWDAATHAPIKALVTGGSGAGNLLPLHDGSLVYSDQYRGRLVRLDPLSGSWLPVTAFEAQLSQQFIAISPDGSLVAGANGGATIRLYNLTTNQSAGVILAVQQIGALAFSPDGQRLYTGGMDGSIAVWDLNRTAEPLATLHGHGGAITDLRALDAHTLISASLSPVHLLGGFENTSEVYPADGSLRRWDFSDVANGTVSPVDLPLRLPQPSQSEMSDQLLRGRLSRMAWLSPDGARLAHMAPGDSQTLMVSDVTTGEPIAQLGGLSGPAQVVAWAPDGGALAASTARGEILLWDLD